MNYGSGNNTTQYDIISILLMVKSNIMKDTHVSDVAIVKSTGDKLLCELLVTGETIECYCLSNLTVHEDDVVLLIFTDNDFRQNLFRLRNNQALQYTEGKSLHSRSCGIIIGTL